MHIYNNLRQHTKNKKTSEKTNSNSIRASPTANHIVNQTINNIVYPFKAGQFNQKAQLHSPPFFNFLYLSSQKQLNLINNNKFMFLLRVETQLTSFFPKAVDSNSMIDPQMSHKYWTKEYNSWRRSVVILARRQKTFLLKSSQRMRSTRQSYTTKMNKRDNGRQSAARNTLILGNNNRLIRKLIDSLLMQAIHLYPSMLLLRFSLY